METGFIHLHSFLRWVVLVLMVVAIFKAYKAKKSASPFSGVKRWAMFAMISLHIQLLLGFSLYFMQGRYRAFGVEGFMKDSAMRFFTIEHMVAMLIAIVIATVGYSSAKRMEGDVRPNNRVFVFYLIALILILASIPWPFREALGVDRWI